jgi:mRNA-degrading endonuclease YafQ of YafQ-DinJ toxin-antitoxin module
MKIIYTFHFRDRYENLPEEVKDKIEAKEEIFRANPFDARLKTHKLSGKYKNYWALSVDYNHRIIFEFQSKNCVIFIAVGDHSIYNK